MAESVECSKCGKINSCEPASADDVACTRCGGHLRACEQCGRLRSVDAVICVQCGCDVRTGRRVVAAPRETSYGNFTLRPEADGAWVLVERRKLLWFSLGSNETRISGFNKVFYDTVDE